MKKRFLAALLSAALLLSVVPVPARAAAPNLLVNPGAEDGMWGWKDPEGLWQSDAPISAHGGSKLFWPKNSRQEFCQMYQDVALPGTPGHLVLSGYVAAYDQNPRDLTSLVIQVFDASGRLISEGASSNQKSDHRWTHLSITGDLPAGITRARVIVQALRQNGSDCDSYADDLSLTFTPTGGTPTPPPQPKPQPQPQPGGLRSDIAGLGQYSSWAEPELKEAVSVGLIPDRLYYQDMTRNITREEFAAIAVKLYESMTGKPAPDPGPSPFRDTADRDVVRAHGLGIVSGIGADLFAPQGLLTREQASAMIHRTYAITASGTPAYTKPAPFADDKSISSWARENVYFMAAFGVICGIGGNRFAPLANATREQGILFALRALNKLTNLAPQPGSIHFEATVGKGFDKKVDEVFSVSAAGDALDQNRTIAVRPLTEQEIGTIYQQKINKGMGGIVTGYDLNAGLPNDQIIPGVFHLEFDLNKLGVPQRLQENCEVVRMDSKGNLVPLGSQVKNGVLSCDTNRNSAFLVAIVTFVEMSLPFDAMAVYIQTEITNSAVPEIEFVGCPMDFKLSNGETFCIDLRYPEKDSKKTPLRMEILKEMELRKQRMNALSGAFASGSSPRIREAMLEFDRQSQRYYELSGHINAMGTQEWLETYQWPDYVPQARDAVRDAAEYLYAVRGFRMPIHRVEVYVCDDKYGTADLAGQAENTNLSASRLLLYKNYRGFKTDLERRLTAAHELFHVTQTSRYSDVEYRSDLPFWEATAWLVERGAYDYFTKKKSIPLPAGSTMASILTGRDKFNNLGHHILSPDLWSDKPEGDSLKDLSIDHGYTASHFLEYLMPGGIKKVEGPYVKQLMELYDRNGGDALKTVKAASSLSDEQLRTKYRDFALWLVQNQATRTNVSLLEMKNEKIVNSFTFPKDALSLNLWRFPRKFGLSVDKAPQKYLVFADENMSPGTALYCFSSNPSTYQSGAYSHKLDSSTSSYLILSSYGVLTTAAVNLSGSAKPPKFTVVVLTAPETPNITLSGKGEGAEVCIPLPAANPGVAYTLNFYGKKGGTTPLKTVDLAQGITSYKISLAELKAENPDLATDENITIRPRVDKVPGHTGPIYGDESPRRTANIPPAPTLTYRVKGTEERTTTVYTPDPESGLRSPFGRQESYTATLRDITIHLAPFPEAYRLSGNTSDSAQVINFYYRGSSKLLYCKKLRPDETTYTFDQTEMEKLLGVSSLLDVDITHSWCTASKSSPESPRVMPIFKPDEMPDPGNPFVEIDTSTGDKPPEHLTPVSPVE